MSYDVVLIRIILSAILGGMVGFEREVHGCAAGLRTHILVSVGSAVFMITSIEVASRYSHLGAVDPSRIAASVVAGIGFLGAGAIIRYGASIRGLTTAASIWAVAAIGLSAGAGLYVVTGVTAAIVVGTLFLSRLEERMELKRHIRKLTIKTDFFDEKTGQQISDIVETYGGSLKRIETSEKESKDGVIELEVDIMLSRIYYRDVEAEISSLPGVAAVSWK